MDAFAVSIAKGIVNREEKKKTALILASFFASFQMLMPVAGYFAGLSFRDIIVGIDHWIAFGLLAMIGLKMIYDSAKKEKVEDGLLKIRSVLILAVATSIDALMVGLSFAFIQTSILESILMIGVVTFLFSMLGFIFGCGFERVFGSRVKFVGGLILIAIGLRILLEHLL